MKRTFAVAIAALGMCAPLMAQDSIDATSGMTEDLGLPEFQQPELWFGSKAPELQISKFVKGDAVTSFETGRVYVVEFWATWCGPCVKAFPHLSELQEHYGDKVTFVGVNIWDREKNRETGEYKETSGEHLKRITEFVDKQDDRMGYTVAIEADDAMAMNWMKAAGRNGIPSAFIVDGSGVIAWMGHPAGMDEPLEQIVAGKFDFGPLAKEAAKELLPQQWSSMVMTELREGDAEKGYALATKMIAGPWKDDARTLNTIAWNTLTEDGFPVRSPEFSIKAATRACEITDWNDPMIMDTLARAYYENGDAEKAFKIQTKAVDMIDADADFAGEFQEWLATYKEAAEKN